MNCKNTENTALRSLKKVPEKLKKVPEKLEKVPEKVRKSTGKS